MLSGLTILLVIASVSQFLFGLCLVLFPAVVNFVNFMDGLDGLVSGCLIVSISVCLVVLGAPPFSWIYVGSLAGFFLWNRPPAKIFMGDVGSTFLGAIYFSLLMIPPSYADQFSLLLVATPLWGDAASCVIRRFLAGQRVFDPHRLHLYQRLHQAGWSHARVSSVYIASTTVLAISLLWGGFQWVIIFTFLQLIIGIFLDRRVAVPFFVASPSQD